MKRIIKRAAVAFTILFLCIATVALSAHFVERVRNANEEYEVYSDYLSDEILNNPHDWSVDFRLQVVIENRTEIGKQFRSGVLQVFSGHIRSDQLQLITRASFIARNLVRTHIQPRFRLPSRAVAVLVPPSDVGWVDPHAKYPRSMGSIALSGVGFNAVHTQAVFYVDHFCGLCGGGGYVLMGKVGGHWQVIDFRSTWIS